MTNKIMTLALLTGMAAGALSYWFNPYNTTRAFGIHIYLLMVLSTFVAAFLLASALSASPTRIALLLCSGVVISVLGRIFFDLSNDPGTHNLFPIEVFVVLVLATPSAFAGTYLFHLMKRLKAA